MANKFCNKCGKEVVPGKRFCAGCGQALPVAAAAPATPAETAPLQGPVSCCVQCGAALISGKRFCKQCGRVVVPEEHAARTIVEQTPAPVPDKLSPVPAVAAAQFEPEVAPPAPFDSPAVRSAPLKQEESQAPPVYAIPPAAPRGLSKQMTVIAIFIGIAAAVLIAAGGLWAWHAHTHRIAPATVNPPANSQPATAQNQPATTATAPQPSKPSPNATASTASTAPVASTPTQRVTVTPPPAPVPQPLPLLPTPAPPPASLRSGVLHYTGPAVPHNGTVVFDHLPKERLRFNFDRRAWLLTLKLNPDGTKKVTMTSLQQGYQTSCNLGWEIVE
jgi:ribosomal protein L33